jgi:transposase
MQYMLAQIECPGAPTPEVIGIDEIAIRKGDTYRIVVSDLVRKRPIPGSSLGTGLVRRR